MPTRNISSLTSLEGRTRDRIADDASDIRDDGHGHDDVPEDTLVPKPMTQLVKEGQEGKLDGPQTGPEEGGDGHLHLHVARRDGEDVGGWGDDAGADADDGVHARDGEVIEGGADGEDDEGEEDQGVIGEEAAEVFHADGVAEAAQERGDAESGPNGGLSIRTVSERTFPRRRRR